MKQKQIDKLRVCVSASSGGHLTQLLKVSKSWEQHDCFYVSSLPVVAEKLEKLGKTYIVGECNRKHPLEAFRVMLRCFKIVWDERPDVVISTGAAPGVLVCFSGKILGAKIVWLDSLANVKRLSMSGRMIRPFADMILTQWPELADKYSNVEYVGSVI
jgi:UDP-N-acetylglucosamine:LPS N-acetylglucosamine transferase